MVQPEKEGTMAGNEDGLGGRPFVRGNGGVAYNALAMRLYEVGGVGLLAAVAAWKDSGCRDLELVRPTLEEVKVTLTQRGEVIPEHSTHQLLDEFVRSLL